MNETNTIHWEIGQLVKSRLFSDEQAVLRSALRALFESQPELKRQMVIRAYTSGDISLGKAAEIMGVSHEEMKEVLHERGAQIHLGPRTREELIKDTANA
jgi:predicted HTH domain antitoxin